MSTQSPQVVDSQEFIPLCDYDFSGDSATVENKRKLVEGYRLKASIFHAAQFARLHRATVYRYMDNDPVFEAAMRDSFQDAADVMETSTYERALGRNGKPDTLLTMFWLKAHRPKYRDKVDVDVHLLERQIDDKLSQMVAPPTPLLQEATSHPTPQPKSLLLSGGPMVDAVTIDHMGSHVNEPQPQSQPLINSDDKE